jgi:FkbM family methyltransferase
MSNGMMKFLKKLIHGLSGTENVVHGSKEYKISYSQCGEDIIVDFILESCFRIGNPTYLDIGAYHPMVLSNTAFFYRKGSRGVCIEPDPMLHEKLMQERPGDVCLNVGIGVEMGEGMDFYIMSAKTLNTFSKMEAERFQSYGNNKIEKVIQVPMMPINDVVEKYFHSCPNFVSLDVESLDLEIIGTWDFSRYRPEVFCIETLTYTEDKSERKIHEIIEYMALNEYFVFADTFINTIFVDKLAWRDRKPIFHGNS